MKPFFHWWILRTEHMQVILCFIYRQIYLHSEVEFPSKPMSCLLFHSWLKMSLRFVNLFRRKIEFIGYFFSSKPLHIFAYNRHY